MCSTPAGGRRPLGDGMISRSWIVVALGLLTGCGLTGFEEDLKLSPEEIESLIDKAPYPELTPSIKVIQPDRVTVKPDGTRTVVVNLVEVLRLSLANNVGFLSSAEGMNLQLLSLEVLRRSWWPLPSPLSASVSWSDSKGGDPSSGESLSLGVSQKLPYGASATFGLSQSGSQAVGPNSYSGGYSLGFSLPLLRGSGWRQGVADIVSGERGYVYARRTYLYSRTELLIQTVQSYFGQLQQEVNITNLQRNLASAKRDAELATLKFGRGTVTKTDVFRAELNVTNAESGLSNQIEQLRLSRDAFKTDLGLRPEDELILDKENIDFKTLEVPPQEALAGAFATNPRWLNTRDQFEDAGRALEAARSSTLPQASIAAGYSWSQVPTTRPFEDFETASTGYSISGSFSLDLDRSTLNQAYQAAVVAYRQSERAFQRARNDMARETQSLLIGLRQAETNMVIQDRARKEAKRALELIEEEYSTGKVRNFEVIQAREQLLTAELGYEAALVGAKVAQLRLLHWIGRLKPDDEGRWVR